MKVQVVKIDHPSAHFMFKALEITTEGEKLFYLCLYQAGSERYIFQDAEVFERGAMIEVPDEIIETARNYMTTARNFKEKCEPFLWERSKEGIFET